MRQQALSDMVIDGRSDFTNVRFDHPVELRGHTFTEPALFTGAVFERGATFFDCTFEKQADFSWCRFLGRAYFWRTTFKDDASFFQTIVSKAGDGGANRTGFLHDGELNFAWTTFSKKSTFARMRIEGPCWCCRTRFGGHADFSEIRFESSARFHGRTRDVLVSESDVGSLYTVWNACMSRLCCRCS